jgi:hypothetical protein
MDDTAESLRLGRAAHLRHLHLGVDSLKLAAHCCDAAPDAYPVLEGQLRLQRLAITNRAQDREVDRDTSELASTIAAALECAAAITLDHLHVAVRGVAAALFTDGLDNFVDASASGHRLYLHVPLLLHLHGHLRVLLALHRRQQAGGHCVCRDLLTLRQRHLDLHREGSWRKWRRRRWR